MSTFSIYIFGFSIFVIGLAMGAFMLGAPPVWIGIGVLVFLGIGIFSGVNKTRTKDESPVE